MGGDVAAVIDSLSQRVRNAGKTAKSYTDTKELAQECRTDTKGVSPCYGAVIFLSSPQFGTNDSAPGFWNYTIRGSGQISSDSGSIDSTTNGVETELLPLQRGLEQEMIAQSGNGTVSLPKDINVILYTEQPQSVLDASRTSNYLAYCMYAFGPIFAFALVELIYHMTSFIAHERELGMSGLIDTMISGGSNIRGRVVRQTSTWLAFFIVYFPSWLVVGIVISVLCFPETSRGLPAGFTILSGLSMASYALFGASFFKKAQLSGSVMTVIAIVGAILPIVLFEQKKSTCAVLSVIFPTANFTYYVTGHAAFESEGKRVSMTGSAYDPDVDTGKFRMPLFFHWVVVVVHLLVFPPMAFAVEHWLHSTASPNKTFRKREAAGDPTVVLSGFCKRWVDLSIAVRSQDADTTQATVLASSPRSSRRLAR